MTIADNVLGNVRAKVDVAIESLCGWFRLSDPQEFAGNFDSRLAVLVAQQAIQSLNPSVEFQWESELSVPPLSLRRRVMKPWVDIWMLLFSNVVKYSAQAGKIKVNIKLAYLEDFGFSLSVTNPVLDGRVDEHVARAKQLIEQGEYTEAVSKEGRTGLRKALKTARVDLRATESRLSVSKESNHFRVTLKIAPVELSESENDEGDDD